jgi:hypothetical protein
MTAFHRTRGLARRTLLCSAAAAVLGLGVAAAPALAATPETPLTEAPTGVTAHAATLKGELNPGSSSGAAFYRFTYGQGNCGEFNSPEAPLELSGNHKTVSAAAEGLLPNTEYTVCLYAGSSESSFFTGEELTGGSPVTFTTLPSPPTLGVETATVNLSGANLAAEVNPNNEPTTYTFDYSKTESAGELVAPILEAGGAGSLGGTSVQTAVVSIGALSPATTYYYRVVAENAQSRAEGHPVEGSVQQFTTLPPPPAVSTGAVLGVAQTSALVTGLVNPQGLASTYEYQYGLSTSYEQSISPLTLAGSSGEVAAPGSLTGLIPGTLYHYRLVAISDDGTSYGEDHTFTTLAGVLPTASTGGASVTGPNAATITGTLNTQGLPTTYGFQIGTEAGSYGPASGLGSVGAGATEANVSFALQNLQPATTYHYRLVASNRDGTQNGADEAFTTPAVSSSLIQPAAPPLIATPAVVFPTATAITGTSKTLTNAQKLASALKACTKKPKRQRAGCERQARTKYTTAKKKAKKK